MVALRWQIACLVAVVLAGSLCGKAMAEDWPQFRGPGGLGVSAEKGFPTTWDTKSGANVLWKVEIPGNEKVTSSPAVVGDRAYVTYSLIAAKGSAAPVEHHVLCLKVSDGSKLWDVQVQPGTVKKPDDRAGWATPTPAADKDAVYVSFASGVVAAISSAGKELWRQDIKNPGFDCTMSVSPVLYDDLVIMVYDRSKGPTITGYYRKSGDVKYDEPRQGVGFGHATPVLVKVKDKPMLLTAGNGRYSGLDPATGKTLWWAKADGDIASPAYLGGVMYCDPGRDGKPGAAIEITGEGELKAKWQGKKLASSFGSPVAAGEYVYRLGGDNIVCAKLSDGEKVYDNKLAGVNGSACLVATGDGLIYAASAGKSYVIQGGADFKIVGTSDLGDASQASPAFADGKIYLRGTKFLWRIGGK